MQPRLFINTYPQLIKNENRGLSTEDLLSKKTIEIHIREVARWVREKFKTDKQHPPFGPQFQAA